MSVVRGLKASYGTGDKKFEIDIPQWEILDQGVTALWGPSGAGKTSVFRLLLGLEKPLQPYQWIDGAVDLAKLSTPERRLGVVFQSLELFPHLTAEENIRFAADARRIPLVRQDPRLKDLTELLQLESFLEKPVRVLSGGQRQRVAIARAVMGEPRLLFLDEPFSALDADLRESARALVKRVLVREKIPAVLISHDRADLDALADKVTHMRDGRIIDGA